MRASVLPNVLIGFTAVFLTSTVLFIRSVAQAALVTHVVVSEVQISGDGGDPANDEFIELYNPNVSPITMTDWKLTRKNSAGTEANLVASLYGSIPAHGFFLIGHGTGYNGSTSLDAPYSAPSNALTNNYAVLLYDDIDTLVDKIGFGSAKDFETTAFGTNPSANGSIERKASAVSDIGSMGPGGAEAFAGNGEDSGVNANDWVSRAASDPQNRFSSIEPVFSPTPTPSPSSGPSATPTPSNGASTTPTEDHTPTPTPSNGASPTPSPSSGPSATPTPSLTPTPTEGAVLGDTDEEDRPKKWKHVFRFRRGNLVCRVVFRERFFFRRKFSHPKIVCRWKPRREHDWNYRRNRHGHEREDDWDDD